MAKVIEFYVPKNFQNAFVRAGQPQPGKVIEFSLQAKKSVPSRNQFLSCMKAARS
jgi:hypothetical protein